jgi:potassium/hydrogen antiporter
MGLLDTVSLTILLGAVLVLAGILSSLVALRFGAPLLLVFLLLGMMAGESGPGGIKFDDVQTTYTVGSIALALILFDGGLRTRLQAFRSALWPSVALATAGVLITAGLTAPAAKFALGIGWLEALLLGAVVASTDAAAVFLLVHSRGLRLRPRVAATLETESGMNDPLAIFLTIMLVEVLLHGAKPWLDIARSLAEETVLGAVFGVLGGRAQVWALNRHALPQGLHAPFVLTGALVIFGISEVAHGSGYLATYLAGLVVGNRPTRAHNTVVTFLDAVTWLAQIVMFTLLGLLVWPERLPEHAPAALLIAVVLTLIARPVAVFLCLAPFRFSWREKAFISWVGLRGAVAIFLASIPLLVGLPNANVYFDVAFWVVFLSLLIQGWSIAAAAGFFHVALPRAELAPRRVELDLPGQLEQELVGYEVGENSPYLRRRLVPQWAKLTLLIRDERILTPEEGGEVREGDHAYFLAPPEKAPALDRFFVDMPAAAKPDTLIEDFFVSGDVALGALAEIYGVPVEAEDVTLSLNDFFLAQLGQPAQQGDRLSLGSIILVAHTVVGDRVTTVGLSLVEEPEEVPRSWWERLGRMVRRALARMRGLSP